MAATFIKNKTKIEAYFTNQDLTAILPELRLEHLISNTEEHEINSSEENERANILTSILESKIVNNPDLFEKLKQFLGSFNFEEDFSESLQPDSSTIIVTFPDDETCTQEPHTEFLPRKCTSSPSRNDDGYYSCTSSPKKKNSPACDDGGDYSHRDLPRKSSRVLSLITRLSAPMHPLFCESTHSEDFSGIEFSSHRSHATVSHRGSIIRGEGVQLRIPPNAIKREICLTVSVQGCISGPFSLPENTQLASPVFLVKCTPQCTFQRQITVTLQHFIHLQSHEQCRNMVLLTSPYKQLRGDDEDYVFSISEQQPQCFPHISYGEVELTHFSFLCFGMRLSRGKPNY